MHSPHVYSISGCVDSFSAAEKLGIGRVRVCRGLQLPHIDMIVWRPWQEEEVEESLGNLRFEDPFSDEEVHCCPFWTRISVGDSREESRGTQN